MFDGLFTPPDYSACRRGRFVNSAFPNKTNLAQKPKFMTDKIETKCLQKFSVSSKQEKECYRKTTSYLEQPSDHFCQFFIHEKNDTTNAEKTFLAINLPSQQKTTKLYFSSQLRKQFKLLTGPFKPLRCYLRSDKLENCHFWKLCKDLFLKFRVIWSVNQIVLCNGFLSDFVGITSFVYTKTIILWNQGE